MAAQIDVRYSVAQPAGDAESNMLGSIAVLEAARASGTRRFVNTSTGGGPLRRRDRPADAGGSPDRAARAVRRRASSPPRATVALYARLHGLSTVSLRYGNVYGPRQDVHGEAGVVAIFCGHLLEGRRPTVFGDGRRRATGWTSPDVVRANLLAADSELGGAINIGHGQETSVLDLIDALREVGAELGAASWRSPNSCPSGPARSPAAASTSHGPGTARREQAWIYVKGCAGHLVGL